MLVRPRGTSAGPVRVTAHARPFQRPWAALSHSYTMAGSARRLCQRGRASPAPSFALFPAPTN
jgi:hypothetical protein